jgi:hypothetical protein
MQAIMLAILMAMTMCWCNMVHFLTPQIQDIARSNWMMPLVEGLCQMALVDTMVIDVGMRKETLTT